MRRVALILCVLAALVTTAAATIVYPPVKYGQQVTIHFSLYDSNSPWQFYETAPAADDVYIRKDGGAAVRVTNAVTDLNHTMSLVLTATEMQAAIVTVDVNDETAPPLYGSETIIVPTFGHASALQAFDLDDAVPTVDVNQVHGVGVVDPNRAGYLPVLMEFASDGVDVGRPALSDYAIAVTAEGKVTAVDVDTVLTTLGTATALDGGTATIAGMLLKMADDADGASFDATTDSLAAVGGGVSIDVDEIVQEIRAILPLR